MSTPGPSPGDAGNHGGVAAAPVPVTAVPMGGDATRVGVHRWHLDLTTYDPAARRFHVVGWLLPGDGRGRVHVAVGGVSGRLESHLPNVPRSDVVDRLVSTNERPDDLPWLGFDLDVPADGELRLGFEREGRIEWVRRIAPAPVGDSAGGLARVLAVAGAHYGPGRVEHVASRRPPEDVFDRVRVHDIDIVGEDSRRRVTVVEKHRASANELAMARRLLEIGDAPAARAFAPVLAVGDPDAGEDWLITGCVEPQPDMYLDPSPFLDHLVEAVRAVDSAFGDLGGEARRREVLERYRIWTGRIAVLDQGLGLAAAPVLAQALEVTRALPVIAGHNDLYWNNLGLRREGAEVTGLLMFDLELLGPDLMGAEFHQFARMAMEAARFRAPFERLIERYAVAVGRPAHPLRVAALANALMRSAMRLEAAAAGIARRRARPRCEEPVAFAGLAAWLADELAAAP